MTKFLSSIFASLLVLSCGKSVGDQGTNGSIVDLSKKPTQQVLALKYAKIQLVCRLWMLRGKNIDVNSAPSDTVIFDLKNGELFVGNSKELKGQLPGHIIDIKPVSYTHLTLPTIYSV